MKPISEARAGHPLYAADINAQSSELRRQGRVSVEGGSINSEGGGVLIMVDPSANAGFFAKINKRNLSFSPVRYGFAEVTRIKNGWEITANGRTSDSITEYGVEFNNNGFVPINAIVELQPIFHFVENLESSRIYGFRYHMLMPVAQSNFVEVVTGVTCTPDGILVTTISLSGAAYDNANSRQFTSLTDVEAKSYIGNAHRAVVVNASETGLTFGAVINHMTTSFISLSDTPNSYEGNAFSSVILNAGSSAIIFAKNLVTTDGSLVGGGNPNSTSWIPIKLKGDEVTVSANKYYGTNSDGIKGYHLFPATNLQAQIDALDARITALGG